MKSKKDVMQNLGITFNCKITLYNLQQSYGSNPQPTKADSKTVWCSIDKVGSKTTLNALAIGVKLTNQVIVWDKEYNGQSYAEFDGIEYKIETATKTGSDLTTRLLLSRG